MKPCTGLLSLLLLGLWVALPSHGYVVRRWGARRSRCATTTMAAEQVAAVPLMDAVAKLGKGKVRAVYAVVDESRQTQYVGLSNHLTMTLAAHLREHGPVSVHSVRWATFPADGGLPQEEMQALQREWIGALPYQVPGNAPGNSGTWQGAPGAVASDVVSPPVSVSVSTSSLSGVLSSDLDEDSEGEGGPPLDEYATLVSEEDVLELNAENVDAVLDEVRPYLISDGGNIRVVQVNRDTREVLLALEGACGSCPSSTVTMKMGVERVLRENFANLGEVRAVSDEPDPDAEELTAEAIEASLSQIRPAITGMGGKIEVGSVTDDGAVTLLYSGPAKLKYGIELAVKDNKLVTDVVFEEAEDDGP